MHRAFDQYKISDRIVVLCLSNLDRGDSFMQLRYEIQQEAHGGFDTFAIKYQKYFNDLNRKYFRICIVILDERLIY